MLKILRILFKTILALVVVFALLTVYSRYIEPHRLTVSDVFIENARMDHDSPGITIAVFADTHFSGYYTLNDFSKVIKAINERRPDMILFCGDLIDNYNTYEGDTEAISEALSRLFAPMGKFAVYGNHDYGGGAHRAYGDIMENGGFTVLQNEAVEFEEIKLTLIGLDDFLLGRGSAEFVGLAAGTDCFNIVLCHEPDVIDGLLEYNVSIMAAAHTHGGQINLGQKYITSLRHIFYPPYGRNYIKGLYRFDNDANTVLYVNPGLATTVLPLRFLNPPEATFITITGAY